ncbi:hypothetical protein [Christiangramia forsetii]|uniref:Secreted protein n=2 Tax=Christiangramia forsetii TaxID=411153 RepID=A0M3S1_CHRFK|nr:hypothetical protein [Christiangramia forsetii]GGG25136.1 hypothetical protein GCM10011532_05590 [Christiangramia forsetii]CAL67266.1 secreted protein [Christiangramia forsetii KT0803]
MKHTFFLFITVFISLQAFSQDTIKRQAARKFISLKFYEETFGKPVDTTEFSYRDNDTLVRVPLDFDPYAGKDYVRVEYVPKDSTFLDIYKDVVYNTDVKIDSTERMKYWKEEIRIFFDESVPVSHTKDLMQFAKTISRDIDSLKITRNFDREKSNYLVYYLNRENISDYEPRITNNTGGYYVSWNGRQQIYDGKLKINTEKAKSEELQLNLLKFHFFKSLGYFRSSKDLVCKSILSACRTLRELTERDLEILNYHYSYGVCKGETLKNFSEQTQRMQEVLDKDPNAKLYIMHHE